MDTMEIHKVWRHLTAHNPASRIQLEAGLLLVLSGRITARPNGAYVRSHPKTYSVEIRGEPGRWYCPCPQGQSFGPISGWFAGYPGRVCKHVAAVAICREAGHYPAGPANLLEFIRRLVDTSAADLGAAIQPIPNGNGVKLVREDDSLGLKLRQVQSGPLAYRIDNEWRMAADAESRYAEWVREAKEGMLVRQP